MSEEIKVQDIFVETKKAVAAYKVEAELLERQEEALNAELEVLQNELTENMMFQEGSGVSDRVNFKIRGKEISSRAEIIVKVLDELQEEKVALKLKYVSIYKQALREDGKLRSPYNANEIVDRHLWAMFSEIVSIGNQFGEQYRAVYHDMQEIFQDSKVMAEVRNSQYFFDRDNYKPSYFESTPAVVHRNDIFLAVGGGMPDRIASKKPKEAVSGE